MARRALNAADGVRQYVGGALLATAAVMAAVLQTATTRSWARRRHGVSNLNFGVCARLIAAHHLPLDSSARRSAIQHQRARMLSMAATTSGRRAARQARGAQRAQHQTISPLSIARGASGVAAR